MPVNDSGSEFDYTFVNHPAWVTMAREERDAICRYVQWMVVNDSEYAAASKANNLYFSYKIKDDRWKFYWTTFSRDAREALDLKNANDKPWLDLTGREKDKLYYFSHSHTTWIALTGVEKDELYFSAPNHAPWYELPYIVCDAIWLTRFKLRDPEGWIALIVKMKKACSECLSRSVENNAVGNAPGMASTERSAEQNATNEKMKEMKSDWEKTWSQMSERDRIKFLRNEVKSKDQNP